MPFEVRIFELLVRILLRTADVKGLCKASGVRHDAPGVNHLHSGALSLNYWMLVFVVFYLWNP